MTILQAWNERRKLRAEGDKLHAEGRKLWAEGDKLFAEGNKLHAEGRKLWAEGNKLNDEGNKLWAEGDKLRAEGNKLRAEGDKLRAEGDFTFISAVIAVYGNMEITWENNDAIVYGVRYEFVEKAACEGKVVEVDGVQYKLVAVK